MLVLSRKPNETIIVGDIVIKIISVHGKQVRVGIAAPDSVRILRGELAVTHEEPREAVRPDYVGESRLRRQAAVAH